jgi:hypothetical protein
VSDLIDMEQAARSLNGFEEIAVEGKFGRAFTDLRGTTMARALLFVVEKRAGMNDTDAFRTVMLLSIEDLEARFAKPDPVEGLAEDEGKA